MKHGLVKHAVIEHGLVKHALIEHGLEKEASRLVESIPRGRGLGFEARRQR
jgi:hypothetical protein